MTQSDQPGPGANGSDQPPLSAYSDDPGTTVADYSVADHTDGQDAGVTDSEAAAAQPDSLPAPGDFQQWGEPDPPPSGTKNSTWEEGAAAPADDTSGQDAGVTDSEAAAAQPDSLPPPGDFQQVGAPDLPGSGTIHETWEEGPAAPGAPPPAAPPDPQPAPPPAPDLVAPEPMVPDPDLVTPDPVNPPPEPAPLRRSQRSVRLRLRRCRRPAASSSGVHPTRRLRARRIHRGRRAPPRPAHRPPRRLRIHSPHRLRPRTWWRRSRWCRTRTL